MKIIVIGILCLSFSTLANDLWNLNFEGVGLEQYKVNQKNLSISRGKGERPVGDWKIRYEKLKKSGLELDNYPFQWEVVDLRQVKSYLKVVRQVSYFMEPPRQKLWWEARFYKLSRILLSLTIFKIY